VTHGEHPELASLDDVVLKPILLAVGQSQSRRSYYSNARADGGAYGASNE
jgi:hypothetical protein